MTLRTILDTLAEGAAVADIVRSFPTLSEADVRRVAEYAAMPRSVHDSNVYAFQVFCEECRIVIYTENVARPVTEFTDVVFSDVSAHYFEHVLKGNILSDIVERPLNEILRPYAELLDGKWGWPSLKDGYNGLDDLISQLSSTEIKAFAVDSSYGMSGWVLAKKNGPDCTPRAVLVPKHA